MLVLLCHWVLQHGGAGEMLARPQQRCLLPLDFSPLSEVLIFSLAVVGKCCQTAPECWGALADLHKVNRQPES